MSRDLFMLLFALVYAGDSGFSAQAPEIRRQPALEQINTPAQEFAPTFTADGKTMIFSSTRGSSGGAYSHLYLSRLVDGKWSAPEPLHSVIRSSTTRPLFSARMVKFCSSLLTATAASSSPATCRAACA